MLPSDHVCIDLKKLKQPLQPDTEYFDATQSILALAERIKKLEQLVTTQHQIQQRFAQSILRLQEEIIELKADRIPNKSSIILPN